MQYLSTDITHMHISFRSLIIFKKIKDFWDINVWDHCPSHWAGVTSKFGCKPAHWGVTHELGSRAINSPSSRMGGGGALASSLLVVLEPCSPPGAGTGRLHQHRLGVRKRQPPRPFVHWLWFSGFAVGLMICVYTQCPRQFKCLPGLGMIA